MTTARSRFRPLQRLAPGGAATPGDARSRMRGLALGLLLFVGCTTATPVPDAVAPGAPGVASTRPDTARSADTTEGTESATGGTATASATPASPSIDRVTRHLRALAVEIGPRPGGSEAERRAADYIAGVLADEGYTTTIETFSFPRTYDDSSVTIAPGSPSPGPSTGATGASTDGPAAEPPEPVALVARQITGGALGTASGLLVDGGTGQRDQIESAGVVGRVVLTRRGDIPFGDKVANAARAGAVAVLVVNNEDGLFRGTLGGDSAIPALAIDGGAWETLRAALGQAVRLEAAAGTRTTISQNVVGRRGHRCRAYLGAHYDSVPEAPGANDNASGTASMLEIARVRATDGLCAVAFGSEEVGLYGSQAFVHDHVPGGPQDGRADGTANSIAFMLNFDMMGRIDRPIIVGDQALIGRVMDILGAGADQPLRPGSFPPFASSDHVSFSSVGVPAVTITSGDDDNMHTPRDDDAAIRRADLRTMLDLGDAAVAGLIEGGLGE